MLHSIYDLTTFCRKTAGDVPAKLVGASTTVVGSKMYLFGGRLVSERKMVSDLYVFDLETFIWEKIPAFPEDDIPRARYFHSTDTWNNQLIIFGGMSNQPDSMNPDELCVLNDVRFFDLATRHWLPSPSSSIAVSESLIPRARYAHLSSVTADRLFIIGGQDFNNTWLDDVCVYDLLGKTWVQKRDYPRHCGTYRSVAVSSHTSVRLPQEEMRNSQSSSTLGPPGQRFGSNQNSNQPPEFTPTESLIHLPYSAPPSEDHPSDIFLYSNYNFTDVKRELEVFSPLPDTDFTIQDRSSAMTGTTFPPGLRFPTGAILGTHLIIAGTYLAHSYQSFSIWVLDLIAMTWSRIDPGKAIETGSWFRGCLWPEANKFIIFGNRNGNLVDDYNRRLLSWDHVAVVDLEAFGIYQPPPLKLDITMQELGLAALEERAITDFEFTCDDGRKIPCSRRILEERWPWFQHQRVLFQRSAKQVLETLPLSSMHVGLPELPGTASKEEPRLDPRLTPRSFNLSESYPISLALLQYFYTTALITPLQHAPAVLSQLLMLATNYDITHLKSLVKHAMHRALSSSTSVGVYEVATLCSCRSLQIRALKAVMSYTQKRPTRNRGDRENGSSGRPGGGGAGGGPSSGPSGGSGGNPNDAQYTSRPRGTSDARWRTMGEPAANGAPYNARRVADANSLSEDQTSPLPFVSRKPSRTRRNRPNSVLSLQTESDIQNLAEFMSLYTHIDPDTVTPAESSADAVPGGVLVSSSGTSRHAHSDSEQYHSDGHFDSCTSSPVIAPYNSRPRPPRIYTDSLVSVVPSLASSTSNSSLSMSRYTSPMTPHMSAGDLPQSDLAIIREGHSDDGEPATPDGVLLGDEEFDGGFDDDGDAENGYDSVAEIGVAIGGEDMDEFMPPSSPKRQRNEGGRHLMQAWPQQKSNVHWVTSQQDTGSALALGASKSVASNIGLSGGAEDAANPTFSASSAHHHSTPPRTGIARFLRSRKSSAANKEELEAQKAEKKRKKEEKAKQERLRREKLRKEMEAQPIVTLWEAKVRARY